MLISTTGSILLAYFIAPSSKFRASIGIAVMWLLILAACLFIVLGGIGIDGKQQTVLDGGVSIVSMVVGLTIGLFITRKLNSSPSQVEQKLLKRISAIKGLGGMTVNERLYVSELDKQFCDALQNDHVKARYILTLLDVDKKSIETILEQSLSERTNMYNSVKT
ncbi:hypothetical protein OQZ33_00375 [Pedobacter sp. MC2016-05]|uniref:hypothetical protein n=1 Tax=Pedobacter sp. MC2016-05 TaxID=2994474 RepID=UPI00224675DA|nr:hypothetical protein [Pedobacter sp. MC2016-05]MCX2472773.1 hypothetical protein [Pedobacter sp. MC2016-05]